MSAPGPDVDEVQPLAVPGDWPDGEEFVCHVLADVQVNGAPLGLQHVDTETPAPVPEFFIRVGAMPGRGGPDRHGTTYAFPFLVECYAPDRRAAAAMMRQVTGLLLALDRGGVHRRILVDSCEQTAADVGEAAQHEDARVRETVWLIQWRRHRGATVWPELAEVTP